jgi:hypothetical protein
MTTVLPASPTPEQVDRAVREAFASHGYINGVSGRVSWGQVRERMLERLAERKVENKKERQAKAVSAGDLVAHVFPNLAQPQSFDEQPDPVLARSVWDKLSSQLYEQTKMSASGPLQTMVSDYMGNGYLVLRTKLGKDSAPAAYISDDYGCIDEDLITPENKSLRNKIEAVTRTREMLIRRQPGNAARYAKRSVSELKAVQEAATERIMLAAAGAAEAVSTATREADSAIDETDGLSAS